MQVSSQERPQATRVPHFSLSSCLEGYVNHSLSVFYTKHFQDHGKIGSQANVTVCRFGASYLP